MFRDCGEERSAGAGEWSQQIADALKKQGTPVWFLIAKDEGHGYRKKPTRIFSSTRRSSSCRSIC